MWFIDLRADGAPTGVVKDINITGSLGASAASQGSFFARFTGTAEVNNIKQDLTTTVAGAGITIDGTVALDNGAVLDMPLSAGEEIVIDGRMQNATIMTHSANDIRFTSTGNITRTGTIRGPESGSYTGDIEIGIGAGSSAKWQGLIEFDDFGGTLEINTLLAKADASAGGIRINGSFLNGGEITITNATASAGAFVSVDYDGYHAGDSWDPNATVTVNSTEYTGNTPAAYIYEITECLGDMTNDETTNNGDIDAFTTGLTDPDDYDDSYPALAGSRIYHGDCNRDTYYNNGDIDAFVTFLSDPGCPTGASESGGGGGGEGEYSHTPASVALMYAENLSSANLTAFCGYLSDLIDSESETPVGAFWEQVYKLLCE